MDNPNVTANKVRHFERSLGGFINDSVRRIFGNQLYEDLLSWIETCPDDDIIAEGLDTWPSVVMAVRWQACFAKGASKFVKTTADGSVSPLSE